jgi:hypothetical protein
MRRFAWLSIACAAAVACAASTTSNKRVDDPGAPLPAGGAVDGAVPPFDAAALPPGPDGGAWHAIVSSSLGPTQVLYALSDVHGGYDRLAAMLASLSITGGVPPSPGAITWVAGDSIVVVAGDLIDKGPQPLEVIDALRALEVSAAAAGGTVIVLLGNHEAELFFDPHNSKATATDGIDKALAAAGIDPVVFASGGEPRGAWLRQRPLGAKVGGWFFSHAGNTKGRSVADLDLALRSAIANHPNYGDPELIGADSILEARDWYAPSGVAAANAAALGVEHVVFGHDPNALGGRGSVATAQSDLLMRIDCGMSPDVNDSAGCALRVRRDGTDEIAEDLSATGGVKEIFRGSP